MKNVIILKSESDNSDNYSSLLLENNFKAIFVPTLEFRFKNLEQLNEKLNTPNKYSGIIFTSPRSIEAVLGALDGDKLPEKWSELHNYSVGTVTFNAAKSSLNLTTKGKESGNATNLSDIMINEFQDIPVEFPFLFPCGNQRMDTLPLKLAENNILLEEIECYETVAHSELEQNLISALKDENSEYVAFFSPSGVNYCNAIFQKHEIDLSNKKLIAIGPSTRKSMESNDLSVYKTAEKPSVEYLVKALLS